MVCGHKLGAFKFKTRLPLENFSGPPLSSGYSLYLCEISLTDLFLYTLCMRVFMWHLWVGILWGWCNGHSDKPIDTQQFIRHNLLQERVLLFISQIVRRAYNIVSVIIHSLICHHCHSCCILSLLTVFAVISIYIYISCACGRLYVCLSWDQLAQLVGCF